MNRTGVDGMRGLTLIELVIALAVGVLLLTLAYPSFQSAVLKARRGEALAGFAQLQMAQERHRSNHPVYATLAQLGVSVTTGGRYLFSEATPTATGFNIVAAAQGGQVADAHCRYLGLRVDGPDIRFASGSEATLANGEQDNRRCWGQ